MTSGREVGSGVPPSVAVEGRTWMQRRPWREREFWLRYSTLYGVIALILVSSILSPHFLTVENLFNVLRQWSMVALIGVGMTFIIINRGIDVSGGSILALGCVLGAAVLPRVGVWGMIVLVLLAGTVCGLLNGLAITLGNIPPFITTLGMMTIARGAALIIGEGHTILAVLPPAFSFWLGTGRLLGVPTPILLVVLVFLVGGFILRMTRYGRHVALVGDSEAAAFAAGIHVRRITLSVYVIHGFLAGLAGLVFLGRLGVGEPTAGFLFEMNAIAAVVLGGTPFTGGQGGVGATFLGVLILGLTYNILNLMGVSPYAQDVARGLIIILAVYISVRRTRLGVR
ncbi:MAG TPA: ABC transporter permease [Candidatus Methylomirabilis sp.]|nr:ABC transporter permease [Candidatus Methylomirabilis sp.]